MKYYGIKTVGEDPYIWWITSSEYDSWDLFFSISNKDRKKNPYRLPLEEAIRAYEAIGYRCVEVEVKQKPAVLEDVEDYYRDELPGD